MVPFLEMQGLQFACYEGSLELLQIFKKINESINELTDCIVVQKPFHAWIRGNSAINGPVQWQVK